MAKAANWRFCRIIPYLGENPGTFRNTNGKVVLGSEHVERMQARTTEFDADFQRFITEMAWGSLWARPDLDRRTRSLVTIAILAALCREELALHLHASHNSGIDPHEIAEVLLQVAVYAGVPAANTAPS